MSTVDPHKISRHPRSRNVRKCGFRRRHQRPGRSWPGSSPHHIPGPAPSCGCGALLMISLPGPWIAGRARCKRCATSLPACMPRTQHPGPLSSALVRGLRRLAGLRYPPARGPPHPRGFLAVTADRCRDRAPTSCDLCVAIESRSPSHKNQPSQSGGLAIRRNIGIQRAYPDHQTGLEGAGGLSWRRTSVEYIRHSVYYERRLVSTLHRRWRGSHTRRSVRGCVHPSSAFGRSCPLPRPHVSS